jgi:ATP synthase delta (OSCP) subunit
MKDSALFKQLIAKLRTKAEVADVLVCLEAFTGTFFSAKSLEEKQHIFGKLPKEVAELLIQAFATAPITPENQISIKRQVDELTDQLRTARSVQLTIAFQADEPAISYFSDWIKKNVNEELVLDLHYDKSIVGGALLIAGGAYKDYSVRKNLATRFQIQRDEIMEILG